MSTMFKILVAFAIGIVLSNLALFVLSKSQRQSLFTWISTSPRGRRASTAKTPPRSLSPETKVPSNGPAPVAYNDIFPPSSREALAKAAATLPPAQRGKLKGLEVSQVEFKKNIIPWAANYQECGPSTYTPMEISIEEVKALGDFPDYAELSGVPLPEEYEEFDMEKAKSRPYRPFRWAYHQTMSLTRLETNWWLEVESDYRTRIAQRQNLYAEHGKHVLDYLPGSELACKELMEMALQFLCARYPRYFSLSHDSSTGHVFHNRILTTDTVINSVHPLHVLLNNIPEDFAVMLRNPDDGYYYFRAGVLCSSIGWNVHTKLGLQLKEIHAPIPDYKEKMEFSMDRYFSKLPPSRPIQRGSWGLEVDKPLFMPPGDPREAHRATQSPTLPLSRVHLRVDWQTLRRLPLSGAIVFNFKALFTPVTEFRDEAYIPALVAKILKKGKEGLMRYKGTWHVEHVVLPAMEEWKEEQVRRGVVVEGWEESTLEESPWFPGWEEKWHRQQGF
ncbi:MAG: putative alpha-mannosyltransferase [Lasallia pustulata]|uniref:Putative alpha-mannosyltransferase n=1 Tax=Lasallia pustulata TaxID=136370 RepID=A0A5M8PPT3_9LECA|nr:MAG: putative alpha-mannosyltransferase [Lasallia pustulata]